MAIHQTHFLNGVISYYYLLFIYFLFLELVDVEIMAHSLLKWWLTIEMVAIIFQYKLISSSFVIISSHTSLSERKRRVKEES